jgi:hypothetical protein
VQHLPLWLQFSDQFIDVALPSADRLQRYHFDSSLLADIRDSDRFFVDL